MARIGYCYITFEDLREYLGQDTADGDAALVKRLGERASRTLERWCRGRVFYPRIETRYYDHPTDDAGRLKVDDDLLAVTTFTTENTNTTISSDDQLLMCGDSYNITPYDRIILATDGTTTQLSFSGSSQKANALTATWGYHDDWANAWQDSQDTVQNSGGITASGTSITVSDADGADLYGEEPRFKVGQLLKIDSEYLYLTNVNATTNALTVIRAAFGSTAATHDADTTIYVYRPMEEVVQATAELAKYLYMHKDATDGDVTLIPEAGMITVPKGVPVTVKWFVEAYRRI